MKTGTWIGFAAMCVGMFMAILDVQVVATSLPAIQGALGIPPDKMSWVQTAYLIAEVIAIPLTGFLTRLLSIRWLFVLALAVFTLASMGCAASSSFGTLVSWRVLQGFSGGTLIPAVFTAVFLLFPVRRQDIATMLAGVLAVLAPTIGPIVGGWITDTYSWHWLFLINVVPGIAAAVLAGLLLPRQAINPSEIRTLDGASLILMAIALAALKNLPQGSPGPGLDRGTCGDAVGCERLGLDGLYPAHTPRQPSNRRPRQFRQPKFHGRMHIEFRAGDWPVRFGLSHAGVSCVCQAS